MHGLKHYLRACYHKLHDVTFYESHSKLLHDYCVSIPKLDKIYPKAVQERLQRLKRSSKNKNKRKSEFCIFKCTYKDTIKQVLNEEVQASQ